MKNYVLKRVHKSGDRSRLWAQPLCDQIRMKIFTYILTFVLVVGCSKTASYKFEPINDVGVNVHIGEVKVSEEGDTYINFKYEIKNGAKSNIRFNTEKIKITVNSKKPVYVHYNSLASTPEANFIIKQGVTEHKLYLMLNGKLSNNEIKDFNVIHFGLEKNGNI